MSNVLLELTQGDPSCIWHRSGPPESPVQASLPPSLYPAQIAPGETRLYGRGSLIQFSREIRGTETSMRVSDASLELSAVTPHPTAMQFLLGVAKIAK